MDMNKKVFKKSPLSVANLERGKYNKTKLPETMSSIPGV